MIANSLTKKSFLSGMFINWYIIGLLVILTRFEKQLAFSKWLTSSDPWK